MKRLNATVLLCSLLLCLLSALHSGCASRRVNPLLSQGDVISLTKKDYEKKYAQANALWLKRHIPQSLHEFIAVQEELAKSNYRSKAIWVRLAHAYYILGEYRLEDLKEKAKAWESGANWAEKALEQKILPNQSLSKLTSNDAEALFWFASNLGRWSTTQGLTQVLQYKDRVKKMIDRVSELQPNLGHGAVYRYYGVYYALLPGYTQDDLQKSKRYFETAIKKYPDYFSNHVLYAQHYADKVGNQNLMRERLTYVIRSSVKKASSQDFYPEQMLEQERAKKILEGLNP